MRPHKHKPHDHCTYYSLPIPNLPYPTSTLVSIKVYPYLRLLATLAKVSEVKRSNSRILIQPRLAAKTRGEVSQPPQDRGSDHHRPTKAPWRVLRTSTLDKPITILSQVFAADRLLRPDNAQPIAGVPPVNQDWTWIRTAGALYDCNLIHVASDHHSESLMSDHPSAAPGAPPSPCIGVCVINPQTQLCDGCYRTLEEIAAWWDCTPTQKHAVLARVEQRMARSVDGTFFD